ncbi:MAG: ABC transporter permease [Syntrophobacteraceae bacterium]
MAGCDKFFDLLRVSLRQVIRHRRRYLGIILAISLGTCGFILVLTVGQDVKNNLNRDLDLLGGSTRIRVNFEPDYSNRASIPKPQWFREETIHALRQIPRVRNLSLVASKAGAAVATLKSGEVHFRLLGVDGAFWEVNSFLAINGDFFGEAEVRGRQRVCVLGKQLAQLIFGTTDVTGRLLPIDGEIYEVKGVLGGTGIAERADYAFIPLTTAQDRIRGLSLLDSIYIRCQTWDDVSPVAAAIPRIMETFQSGDRYHVEVAWEQLKRVQRIAWWMQTFIYLSIIATLVLGGLGIWNGMMASVQARTREIGLKKAIGAEDRDILIQFLGEAWFLSVGSALFGIVLGRGAVQLVSLILKSPPSEELFVLSVGLSIVFSLVLGVGAGFTPSTIASRMEVVSALRYE